MWYCGIVVLTLLVFLLEIASDGSWSFTGTWMIYKSHHNVLVFILASLGFSSSARDLSPRILTSIEFSIFQTFGYCCGFTFHWTIVLFCLIAEVSTGKYKSPSILTAPGPSFRQLQIFCWSIHPMSSLLKSGLRQVVSSWSKESYTDTNQPYIWHWVLYWY